jgi:hypothetical protein
MNESINWRTVAAEYRRRLHVLCFLAAFALYLAFCFGLSRLSESLHLEAVWVENIAMFIWFPLGAIAFYFKNLLEDWVDRGLPSP